MRLLNETTGEELHFGSFAVNGSSPDNREEAIHMLYHFFMSIMHGDPTNLVIQEHERQMRIPVNPGSQGLHRYHRQVGFDPRPPEFVVTRRDISRLQDEFRQRIIDFQGRNPITVIREKTLDEFTPEQRAEARSMQEIINLILHDIGTTGNHREWQGLCAYTHSLKGEGKITEVEYIEFKKFFHDHKPVTESRWDRDYFFKPYDWESRITFLKQLLEIAIHTDEAQESICLLSVNEQKFAGKAVTAAIEGKDYIEALEGTGDVFKFKSAAVRLKIRKANEAKKKEQKFKEKIESVKEKLNINIKQIADGINESASIANSINASQCSAVRGFRPRQGSCTGFF